MSSGRIRGQETELVVVQDGRIVTAFNYVRNHEITLAVELIEEHYLGRTTADFD